MKFGYELPGLRHQSMHRVNEKISQRSKHENLITFAFFLLSFVDGQQLFIETECTLLHITITIG